MQAGKLSGELLIWRGSPLALTETEACDAEPGNENLADEGETPAPSTRAVALPPQAGALPPQAGALPPQAGALPPQAGALPPQAGALPPQAVALPPQAVALPPQRIGWFLAIGVALLAISGTVGLALRPVLNKTPVPPVTAIAIPPAAAKLAADAVDPGLRPPLLKPAAIAPSRGDVGGAPPEAHKALAPALAATTAKPTGPAPPNTAARENLPKNTPKAAENSAVAKVVQNSAPAKAATPAVIPASAPVAAAESVEWRARGDALFVAGALAPARQFYELAADAGDGQAALQLGETYDPAFLAQAKITRERGDPAVAAHWYEKASKLGAASADILLKAVMAEPARPSSQ
jgi:hypothetical protein